MAIFPERQLLPAVIFSFYSVLPADIVSADGQNLLNPELSWKWGPSLIKKQDNRSTRESILCYTHTHTAIYVKWCVCKLAELWWIFYNVYIYQIKFYVLKVYNFSCEWYLSKVEKRKIVERIWISLNFVKQNSTICTQIFLSKKNKLLLCYCWFLSLTLKT